MNNDYCVAIGKMASGWDSNSIAIGQTATSTGYESIAIGKSIAIGECIKVDERPPAFFPASIFYLYQKNLPIDIIKYIHTFVRDNTKYEKNSADHFGKHVEHSYAMSSIYKSLKKINSCSSDHSCSYHDFKIILIEDHNVNVRDDWNSVKSLGSAAIGHNVETIGDYSSGFGAELTVKGFGANAIGYKNKAMAYGAFSRGENAEAKHMNSWCWSDGKVFQTKNHNEFAISARGQVRINNGALHELSTLTHEDITTWSYKPKNPMHWNQITGQKAPESVSQALDMLAEKLYHINNKKY